MIRIAIPLAVGFALGALVISDAYERQEREKIEETKIKVKGCDGYLVLARDGQSTECRRLMPQFDIVWPVRPSPLRLTKRQMHKAIAGDFTERSSNH